MPGSARFQLAATLAVLATLAALLAAGLRAPLLDPQEARYAEIPREMREAGEWVIPQLRGQPYLEKPPLLYWLVTASPAVFGGGGAPGRRVPAAAALLTVAVTWFWGYRTFGSGAGLAGAAVLTLSPFFVYF